MISYTCKYNSYPRKIDTLCTYKIVGPMPKNNINYVSENFLYAFAESIKIQERMRVERVVFFSDDNIRFVDKINSNMNFYLFCFHIYMKFKHSYIFAIFNRFRHLYSASDSNLEIWLAETHAHAAKQCLLTNTSPCDLQNIIIFLHNFHVTLHGMLHCDVFQHKTTM